MENASKALIIAGAILISILIIALGVFIFQKASGTSRDLGGLDETKVQSVNAKFEAYEGKQSGTDVKALIDLVRTNNNQYKTSASDRVIEVNGKSDKEDLADLKNKADAGKTYTVKVTGYVESGASTGLINVIKIEGL